MPGDSATRKYVIFGFDMETDIGNYLPTYNGLVHGTPKLLDLLARHRVRGTFLFTGNAALANEGAVTAVCEAGHEVGCHSLKHETLGDAGFNMPNDTPILEWEVEQRLVMNAQIVERITGREPVSFRAPRLWQGQGQVLALEKLGFLVDASYSAARYGKQIVPYHPSRENWLEAGDMRILEIPNFAFLDKDYDYSRFFCKNDQWPLLRLLGAEFVFDRVQFVIREQKKVSSVCVLLFYLHPWEFEEMPDRYEYDEGYFVFKPELYQNCGEHALGELDRFIQLCLGNGFSIVTMQDFYAIWQEAIPHGSSACG